MISRTVTYTDFNDKQQTETVWFHLSRDVIFDNLDLEDEFEKLEEQFSGDKRELTKPEVIEILKLVKRIFRISYGVRTGADGERFRQTDEVWQDFKDSAAYDAMLWDLFSKPEEIFSFLNGIMPKDLREQAQAKMAEREGRKMPQDRLPKQVAEKPASENVFDTTPSEVVEEESVEERRERLQRELAELS